MAVDLLSRVLDRLVGSLRRGKHSYYIVKKKRLARRARAESWLWVRFAALFPYCYDPQRYPHSFLHRTCPPETQDCSGAIVPRRVFVMWTGANAMPLVRQRSLLRIQQALKVPVQLVTPETLGSWILPDHPLHSAYENLSLTHRSDYLRAYFMHYHGGGYMDLKSPTTDWSGVFSGFVNSSVWVIGYRERSVVDVVQLPGSLGVDMRRHHSELVGNCAFVVRPGTAFTYEWLREVERRLDYFADQLREFPGGVRDEVLEYPVGWTDLQGAIYQPLQLKYFEHILINDDVRPIVHGYL